MKPIHFTIPGSFEELEAILQRISQESPFEFEPDWVKKSGQQSLTYRILNDPMGDGRPELVCLLEATQAKEKNLSIKISEQYITGRKTLPVTGSPLTRFVTLLMQNLMVRGKVS